MSQSLLSLLSEERRERFAQVTQDKRVAWANCSHHSWQKSYMSDSLVIRANRSQKRAIRTKKLQKTYILYFFDSFSPFLFPRVNSSRRNLLSSSFLKSNMSDSIRSLFTKERPWANCSGCSLQKRDIEQFPEKVNCTFAQKNEQFARKTDDLIPNPDKKCPF